MTKQNSEQQQIVGRVMHEFKRGELTSAGGKVRNPKQAIAIGLSEAGASNRETPDQNKHNLQRTRSGGGSLVRGGPTRQDLYAEAAKRSIAERSKMSKAELQRALQSS